MQSLVSTILTIFMYIIFVRVIVSFIIPLVGARPHPMIITVNTLVNQITEPVLGPIRRSLPTFGGLDFSPMAVFIVIILLQKFVVPVLP